MRPVPVIPPAPAVLQSGHRWCQCHGRVCASSLALKLVFHLPLGRHLELTTRVLIDTEKLRGGRMGLSTSKVTDIYPNWRTSHLFVKDGNEIKA